MRACMSAGLLRLLCAWAALGAASGAVRSSAPTVVQALSPSGLRISVPDETDLNVVVINANVNAPIETRETGQVSGTVLEPEGGYWSLQKDDVTLKPGDVVFYWVYTAKGETSQRVFGNQRIYELVEPSCQPSATTVNGRPACKGQVIFEDNFDTLNTSIWKHLIQFSDEPDFDFSIYGNNPENSFTKDGKLHLKATVLTEDELLTPTKLQGCTKQGDDARFCERKPIGWDVLPPTRSAMLTTKGTFSFRFGRVDIRAKTAAGDWLLSKLQLNPQTPAYGRGFESGKVEIARIRGNADLIGGTEQTGGVMNVLQADIETCRRTLFIFRTCVLNPGDLYANDMHMFSVVWTPEFITITIDGHCVHKINAPTEGFLTHGYFKDTCNDSPWKKGTRFAPFDREFFIQLSLMVGGFHAFSTDDKPKVRPWKDKDPKAEVNFWRAREEWEATWKSDFEIDYVKAWAL